MKIQKIIVGVSVFVAVFGLLYTMIYIFVVMSDITTHVNFIVDYLNNKDILPANFLFYYFVIFVSFFSADNFSLLLSAILVLSIASAFKFMITSNIISKILKTSYLYNLLLTGILFLSVSLPSIQFYQYGYTGNYIMGYFPANVWHNSTIIFLFPFALLLFWVSYQQIIDPNNRRMVIIILLCILNALIKPSFLFCFVLVYPVFMMMRNDFKNFSMSIFLPSMISILIISIQYFYIYISNSSSKNLGESSVIIAPLSVWVRWLEMYQIPISIIFSFLFPITYFIVYRPKKISLLMKMTLTYLIIGLLMFVFLAESGQRKFNANFSWQNIIITYIFFLVTITEFVKAGNEQRNNSTKDKIKYYICYSALMLHLSSGIVYIYKIFLTGRYH